MDASPEVPAGWRVDTYDGRAVGTVLDLRDGRLFIRPRARSPFWVPDVLVRSVEDDTVVLHVGRRSLARYRHPVRWSDAAPKRRVTTLSFVGNLIAAIAVAAAAWTVA